LPVAFTLTSPDHLDGAEFAAEFTCNGRGLGKGANPELDWIGVPAGTKSLALTFIDTTAAGDIGQHWAIWDIPVSVLKLPKALDKMLTGVTGAKQTNAYLPPCPAADDRYEFRLYALDQETLNPLPSGVTAGMGLASTSAVKALSAFLERGPTLGKTVLSGTCQKQM
jgi:Raf kinase inhibitor-like YbhB/YbcL family protein